MSEEKQAVGEVVARESMPWERGFVKSVERCPECGLKMWVLWYESEDGREVLAHECSFCGWSSRDE